MGNNQMNYALQKITAANAKPLYDYYIKIAFSIPYYHSVSFETWSASMFADCDSDGATLFDELLTFAVSDEVEIVGFIQFGISSFIFNQNGDKEHGVPAGIIRNIHYERDEAGAKLITLALDYFDVSAVDKRWAFFHAFGMTCNARHGKLHSSVFYIEDLLFRHGFEKEHENVYYKKLLSEESLATVSKITLEYSPQTAAELQNFEIIAGGEHVGGGELTYLPQGEMCYLTWIYIAPDYQKKGYAVAALHRLFCDLSANGVTRIDTDTADGNEAAQKLYEKVGFENMGRTRSYIGK